VLTFLSPFISRRIAGGRTLTLVASIQKRKGTIGVLTETTMAAATAGGENFSWDGFSQVSVAAGRG
jgi:hypothetical protein